MKEYLAKITIFVKLELPDNLTKEQVQEKFHKYQDHLADSNTGSEKLANAQLEILNYSK